MCWVRTTPTPPKASTTWPNSTIPGEADGGRAALSPSLEIQERVLGPDHPDTALSLHNLAVLYRAQGKLTEQFRGHHT